MKKLQTQIYRCVIGEIESKPNKLDYLQPISSRKHGVWIGHCNGDKVHDEHIVVLKKARKYYLLNNLTDIFKKPSGKILGKRLFDRCDPKNPKIFLHPKLRCPIGKVYMNLQYKATSDLNMPRVDIYKCKGSFLGSGGHKEHYVRINHGALGVEINKKIVGVLIITTE